MDTAGLLIDKALPLFQPVSHRTLHDLHSTQTLTQSPLPSPIPACVGLCWCVRCVCGVRGSVLLAGRGWWIVLAGTGGGGGGYAACAPPAVVRLARSAFHAESCIRGMTPTHWKPVERRWRAGGGRGGEMEGERCLFLGP